MSYTVEVKDSAARCVVTMRKDTTPEALADTFGEILPAVASMVAELGGERAGAPFGMYHHFSPERVDVEAGVPVASVIEVSGEATSYEMPAARVASLMHVGSYDGLGEAHAALMGWVAENGHEIAGATMEIYWTDPGAEPDPSAWRTELLVPIA